MNHQIKIAAVNLKKSAFTTFLNLVGLTSAFASFILIMLYVWNEYHFDGFQKNAPEIYRLEMKSPDEDKTSVFMLGPTGQTLVDEFPEIISSTTYMPWGKWGEQSFNYETHSGEQSSYEDYAYADENLTDVFSFQFIHGAQDKPLENPETAIISESFAQKVWGKDDPVGKWLRLSGTTYTITGVYKDLPENSVFRCPIILKIPSQGWIAEARKGWNITNYPQFILVKPGTNPEHLNKLLNEQSIVRSKYSFYENGKISAQIVARPLSDLRFTREVAETPMFESNNKMFIDSLFWVGILILLVAVINYINFATASIPRRMKTFNINRIIGSSRWNSVIQLMIETLVVFVVSFGLAVFVAYILNQLFSQKVLGYELPFARNLPVLLGSIGIALVSAFVAGLYPAIISTSGKPIDSLKRYRTGLGVNFRGTLTVFQFAATIALIVASVAVIKQVRFMEESDLGFNKNNTLVIRLNDGLRTNFEAFRSQLEADPYVSQVACSRAVPGQTQENRIYIVEGKSCSAWSWAVDDQYMDMMGFKIIDGRGFLKNSEADNGNFICNQTAAQQYGWKVGTKIGNGMLVGIMKDFNLVSLREKVDPFVFYKSDSFRTFGFVSIKLQGGQTREALASIQAIYKEFSPQVPFRSYFLDDHLHLLYTKENQQASLITFFGLLSIIVSVLGILGLSIYMIQQKTKEIGIRKVNGARTSEVMMMLNKDFVKWVIIAFIIATPLAWYAMNGWLQNFTFRTSLSWWIFVLAGVLALGIALFTVSFQSWKAAMRNPVEALRYE